MAFCGSSSVMTASQNLMPASLPYSCLGGKWVSRAFFQEARVHEKRTVSKLLVILARSVCGGRSGFFESRCFLKTSAELGCIST